MKSFKEFLASEENEGVFDLKWCHQFNQVLLPHLHDSPNTSFAGLEDTTAVLEEAVKVRNFTPGSAFLPATVDDLRDYRAIESNFHRITSNLCPLVNVLLIPMGISKNVTHHGGKVQDMCRRNEVNLREKKVQCGVVPYLVPQVNHRQKNPTLALGLMGDTLMSQSPSDHFRSDYTTLPIHMVAASERFEKPAPGSLKNWDTLGDSNLVGSPTALLMGNAKFGERGPGKIPTLPILFCALQGEENQNSPEQSLDAKSIQATAETTKNKFEEAAKSSPEPVDGRLLSLGLHTMSKQLLNSQILKFSSQTTSICAIFSSLCALMKKNIPFLRPFFPYDMSTDSIYPFHHTRVLLGALTTERVSMLEGNHRSFVSVDALFGGLLGGYATSKVGQKLNAGLLLQPAKVSDVLPCIPDTRSHEIDEVVCDHLYAIRFFRLVLSLNTNLCSKLAGVEVLPILFSVITGTPG
jgi:hypothetical protein